MISSCTAEDWLPMRANDTTVVTVSSVEPLNAAFRRAG
jgi:hypothetical protein